MAANGTMGAVLTLVQTGAVADGTFQWWVELLTGIATIVIALTLILIALVVIPIAWKARSAIGRLNSLVGKDIRPLLQRGEQIGENVSQISDSVRKDVELIHTTLVDAQQRVSHAAGLAEDRINQFSALMELVQEEAESLFIDSASIVRGVQAGTERLRNEEPPPGTRRSGRSPEQEI